MSSDTRDKELPPHASPDAMPSFDRAANEPSHQSIGVIILAAGASRRFGMANKLLANVRGKPLVAHVANVVRSSLPRARTIGVVSTGTEADAVAAALRPCVDAIAVNERSATGIASSVKVGLSSLTTLAPDCVGALIVQGDMPNLSAELIQRLRAVFFEQRAQKIVVPSAPNGSYRSPVLWPRNLFTALCNLHGDQGGRQILRDHVDRVIAVAIADQSAFVDIDTQADLTAWRQTDARTRNQ